MAIIYPEKIISSFIKQFEKRHKDKAVEIEGILLFGSSLNPETMSKNSDLDLYLIIKNIGKRYRGVMRIDNTEVDYFVNPIEQLRIDFDNAKKNKKMTVLFMLANGNILKDQNGELSTLKNEAVKFLEEETRKQIPEFQITFIKYFIDDYLKDTEDCYIKKDWFSFQYNIHLLLNYLIEVFCNTNQILLLKPKYQKDEIKKKDNTFVKLYEDVEKATMRKEKIKKLKNLSKYVLSKIGGKLSDEWELESNTAT